MNYYLYNGQIKSEKALLVMNVDFSNLKKLSDSEIELYLASKKPTAQQTEREWRDGELSDFVDYHQSKPLMMEEMTEEEVGSLRAYRTSLKDYPSIDGFGDISLRPVRPFDRK